MTRHQLIEEIRSLPPAQRRAVIAAALTIRAAREAGDQRPAGEIVAHMVQPQRGAQVH